jgi:hypothetical protein
MFMIEVLQGIHPKLRRINVSKVAKLKLKINERLARTRLVVEI